MSLREPSVAECFDLRRGIAHAFAALQAAAGPLWLAGLLLSIAECSGGNVPLDLSGLGHSDGDQSRLAVPPSAIGVLSASAPAPDFAGLGGWLVGGLVVLIVIGACVALGLFALNAWLSVGCVRLHVAVLEQASDALGPLFSGRDRFWPMVGYKMLAGLTLSAAILVAGWPGALIAYVGYVRHSHTAMIAGAGCALILIVPLAVYVALGTYLGELAIVLDDASPAYALRRSFALAARGRGWLLLFAFVCFSTQAVSGAGILLCCVGVLATVPFARSLTGFAKTESYLLLTRGYTPSASWRLWQRAAVAGPAGTAVDPTPAPETSAEQDRRPGS